MQQNNLTGPLVIIYYWVPIVGVDWSLAQDIHVPITGCPLCPAGRDFTH